MASQRILEEGRPCRQDIRAQRRREVVKPPKGGLRQPHKRLDTNPQFCNNKLTSNPFPLRTPLAARRESEAEISLGPALGNVHSLYFFSINPRRRIYLLTCLEGWCCGKYYAVFVGDNWTKTVGRNEVRKREKGERDRRKFSPLVGCTSPNGNAV